MTSSANQTPSLIMTSLTTTVSVIVAIFLTSLIRRGSCSSPGGLPAAQRNASGYHDGGDGHLVSTSSVRAQSRDDVLLHPMRLRREQGEDGESGGGGEVHRFPCYTCMFMKESSGFTTGSEDCSDPFVSRQMPEVMCSTSCNKMMKKNDGGITIFRGCVANCVEKNDKTVYNRCCKSRLCNRSASLNSVTATAIYSALLTYFLSSRSSSF